MISKKQQQILKTAQELFWKHGFKRVSVEEICVKANVSKMTFYRFYPNKIALAKAVFDNVMQEGMDKFAAIMHENVPHAEKMKNLLMIKAESTNDISREFLMDFYNSPELGLMEYIDEKTRQSWAEILKHFREAQEKGDFRKDFKPEIILALTQKMSELITDDNLLKLYSSPQELVMEIANFFTYGITPHE